MESPGSSWSDDPSCENGKDPSCEEIAWTETPEEFANRVEWPVDAETDGDVGEASRKRRGLEKGPEGSGQDKDLGEREKVQKHGPSAGSGPSVGSGSSRGPPSAVSGQVMRNFVSEIEDDLVSVTSDEGSDLDLPLTELELWSEARFGCRRLKEEDIERLRDERMKTKADLSRMIELSRRKSEIEDTMDLSREERARLNQQSVEMVSLARHLYRQARQQLKMAKLVREEQHRPESEE